MDKRPIVFFVLALFVFSVFAIAANAENQTNDNEQNQTNEQINAQDITLLQEQEELASEEDMNDSEITHTPLGAKVRLLQLEKQVVKSYLYGEQVISLIKTKEYNVSTTGLQTTVDSLKSLDAEIKALLEKNLTSDSVDSYVDFKHRATNLTKEFRDTLRAQLTVSQRQEIKDAVDKKDFTEVDDINEEIRQAVKDFNKERTLFMLNKLGLNNTELLAKVESGNITAKELREEIKNSFKSLIQEKKKDFLKKIDEEKIKVLTQRQKAFAKGLGDVKEQMGKAKEHMEKAKDLLDDKNLTYMEKKAKLGVMVKGEIDEKVKDFADMHNTTSEEIKEKVQDRIQELKERRENRTEIIGKKIEDKIENMEEKIEDRMENRVENRLENMRGGKE